ncbi:hypothetical protein NPIL_574591 [Nephila pilipes]|uniref:Uncharacterized protein n=1 Tax=Nephila pilipes TaxID=299642 RepID=A0A8X6UIX6_NEPPI|nr:hypothetical protein NPIL_574591 [Nephila pilipes]
MTRRVLHNRDAVKYNRGIPTDEGLARSSAKGCRPAQCRLRSQPRKNPSLATVRGERNFVRQHEKELSRRSCMGIWTVVCGRGCMTRLTMPFVAVSLIYSSCRVPSAIVRKQNRRGERLIRPCVVRSQIGGGVYDKACGRE